LPQRTLGIEGDSDVAELVGSFNDLRKGGRAQLEGDVKEAFMRLLVVIPDDVWVVVCVLKETDFALREDNKVPKETFYSHSAAL